MKKDPTYYMLFILLFALIVLGCFQGRIFNDYIKYFAILTTIVSVLIAIRHFKLSSTLNKIQAMTLRPETSEHIVRAIKYLDNIDPKKPETLACKKNIENDNELFISVNFILGFYDDLAIAIKHDIINEKLTKEIIGCSIITITTGFKQYIIEISKYRNNQSFSNLIWLNSRWENTHTTK